MAINATNTSTPRELIPSGNYIARCYQMIEVGTVKEIVQGEPKTMHKVRIGWELPNELKVFKQENGEQPCIISCEYTLSMNEKSNLRKMLASWRGKDFTPDEAKSFDITKLLGVACMLNIIHKPSEKDPTSIYEKIAGVSPMPKGVPCPEQINKMAKLEFDNFDYDFFNTLPDFIRTKIQSSEEYKKLQSPQETAVNSNASANVEDGSDLPF